MKFKNIRVAQRNKAQTMRDVNKHFVQQNALNTLRQPPLDYAALQEEVRAVLFDCMEYVMLELYKENPEIFAEYANTVEVILKQYAIISHDMNKASAEKWLLDKLRGKYRVTFMLPVTKHPKKGKERAEFDFMRQEAALWAKAFCYAFGQILTKDAEVASVMIVHDRFRERDIDDIFCAVARQYRERAHL